MFIYEDRGLLNKFLNRVPIELHLPGYQYCGPGTKLAKRIARGDSGINPLDAACKEHDIAYSQNRENVEARNTADRVLAEKAWQRVWSKDAGLDEKVAACATTNAMKIKSKLGMGLKKKKKLGMGVKKSEIMLSKIVKAASKSTGNNSRKVIRSATGGKSNVRVLRIQSVTEKMGGFLPFLIPLCAGFSATGALVLRE